MGSARPLEIKVVYPAARRRRTAGATRVRRTSGAGLSALVGVLSLSAAAGLYYATLWPIDRFIGNIFFYKLPLFTPEQADAVSMIFSGQPVDPAMRGARSLDGPVRRVGRNKNSDTPAADKTAATGTNVPKTPRESPVAQTIVITALSWQTLSVVTAAMLAIAGGAAWVGVLGRGVRPLARTGVALALLVLAAGTIFVWFRYKFGFPLDAVRLGIGGLLVLALLLGLAFGHGGRVATRFAGVGLVAAALCTAVALYIGWRCAAVDAGYASLSFLAQAFLIHSAFGWLLLPLAGRLRRAS